MFAEDRLNIAQNILRPKDVVEGACPDYALGEIGAYLGLLLMKPKKKIYKLCFFTCSTLWRNILTDRFLKLQENIDKTIYLRVEKKYGINM